MKTVLKVLAALAAVAGAIYLIATYGDRIVAWAKKLLASCPCHNCCDVVIEQQEEEAPAAEEPAAAEAEEAAPAEAEAPAAEPAPEIPENEPVAEEADFEG